MANSSTRVSYDDTTAKHVYTTVAVNVAKTLLLRGFNISPIIDILKRSNSADDIAMILWKSTSRADFEELRMVFDFDYDNEMQPLVKKICPHLAPYHRRVVHAEEEKQRQIVTIFIAGSGSEKDTAFSSSTGTKANSNLFSSLIVDYSGNDSKDTIDIILVTEDKLTAAAAGTLEHMKLDPGLPRIWHFRYEELIKFAPEATMMPYQTMYTDPDAVKELISKYEKTDAKMTYCLDEDMTFRIYGAKFGDAWFIERYNPDPASMARRIPYLRIASPQVMPKY